MQSAALKIICDRENQINDFVPEEYWNITAEFKKGRKFSAKLVQYQGGKVEIPNEETAQKIAGRNRSRQIYDKQILKKKKLQGNRMRLLLQVAMQQDASNKLGFNTKRTMFVAQQLYEGVSVKGHGTIGLVSYIRTDSVRISDEARLAARDYIKENFGEKYYSEQLIIPTEKKKFRMPTRQSDLHI